MKKLILFVAAIVSTIALAFASSGIIDKFTVDGTTLDVNASNELSVKQDGLTTLATTSSLAASDLRMKNHSSAANAARNTTDLRLKNHSSAANTARIGMDLRFKNHTSSINNRVFNPFSTNHGGNRRISFRWISTALRNAGVSF